MMGVVASLITKDSVILDEVASINISYPTFLDDLNKLIKSVK